MIKDLPVIWFDASTRFDNETMSGTIRACAGALQEAVEAKGCLLSQAFDLLQKYDTMECQAWLAERDEFLSRVEDKPCG